MEQKNNKIKVGMVQINNSFSRQNYLPLSLGFLHSYAGAHGRNFSDFEFLTPIYKRIPVNNAVEQLSGSDIACFSTYVWNFNISSAIAKRLKQENPNILIVFGGCQVPEPNIRKNIYEEGKDESYENYIKNEGVHNLETMRNKTTLEEITVYSQYDKERDKGLKSFLEKNNFIDIASTGEGEIVFTSILENYSKRKWGSVPGVHYINEDGKLISTFPPPRIEDLNDIPSPFLTGYFEDLINSNPEENWIGLFETNRGCPFGCTFCDWGIESKNRIANYDLEGRLFPEIDWFSQKKIPFVYCCDANFGMYKDRDLSIAQKFAENKKMQGYPERFSVQNTKNSTEASYNIQRVLVKSGLDKGVLLAFQSLHEPTLEAIKRRNIKLDTFFDLQKRHTSDGTTTFSDIILGLPLETYETFIDGVSKLIERGQHNRIQFNNLSILPNAPMVEHIKKYDLDVVDTKIINIHGSLAETEEINEMQRLVVGNSTMPREDWARARAFGYMTAFLHFDKLLQIPNIILNMQYGIKYGDIVDRFLHIDQAEKPVLSHLGKFFFDKARNIQNGGA